ncbi:MAG TPA: STAS domain-containing protein [Terriglobales bacterium]|nr:STAS domain-containing protein [Terriglobales bacterium]
MDTLSAVEISVLSSLNNFERRRQARPSGEHGQQRHYDPLFTYRLQIGGIARKLEFETSLPPSRQLATRVVYSIVVRAIGPVPSDSTSADTRERLRTSRGRTYNLPVATEPLEIERLTGKEGPHVLCLRGPLTLENLPLFQNAIRREENVPMVIVDLSDVPYIDSSGLGSLVSAYVTRHKATRRIALSGVNDRVLKLFETTKVEPLFLIFPTLDDAITALTTAAEA